MTFDKAYYESCNYASYLERGERYFQLISELHHEFLPKIGLGDLQDKAVLDYGCAVGFVVKALRQLGYRDVTGFDVSEWAVNYGNNNLRLDGRLTTDPRLIDQREFHLTLALDVLEHLNVEELQRMLRIIKTDYMIARMPVSAKSGERYVLDVSEKDPTHLLRWTKSQWKECFESCGFDVVVPLRLHNIYDTPGVMCALLRRKGANLPFSS